MREGRDVPTPYAHYTTPSMNTETRQPGTRGHTPYCSCSSLLTTAGPLTLSTGGLVRRDMGNGSPFTWGMRFTISITAHRFRRLSLPTYLGHPQQGIQLGWVNEREEETAWLF